MAHTGNISKKDIGDLTKIATSFCQMFCIFRLEVIKMVTLGGKKSRDKGPEEFVS